MNYTPEIAYDRIKSIHRDLQQANPTDKSLFTVINERLKVVSGNTSRFLLGKSSFQSQVNFITNHLTGLTQSLKEKTINEEQAKRVLGNTNKKLFTLRRDLLAKIEMKRKRQEINLKNQPQTNVLLLKNEKKKTPFKSFSDLGNSIADIITEDTNQVVLAIDPIGGERARKPGLMQQPNRKKDTWFTSPSLRPSNMQGEGPIDIKMLQEEREKVQKQKEHEDYLKEKAEEHLKILKKFKPNLPNLGDNEYKIVTAPLFVPILLSDTRKDKLRFKAERVFVNRLSSLRTGDEPSHGGCILYDQKFIMTSPKLAKKKSWVEDIIKRLSDRTGRKYVAIKEDYRPITTKSKSNVVFVWIMEQSELKKFEGKSLEDIFVQFAWDIEPYKENKIGINPEVKRARAEIEEKINEKFKNELKDIEKYKDEILDINEKLDSLEIEIKEYVGYEADIEDKEDASYVGHVKKSQKTIMDLDLILKNRKLKKSNTFLEEMYGTKNLDVNEIEKRLKEEKEFFKNIENKHKNLSEKIEHLRTNRLNYSRRINAIKKKIEEETEQLRKKALKEIRKQNK